MKFVVVASPRVINFSGSPELLQADYVAPTATDFTLIGIESLLCLREACEDAGLTGGDIEDIFQRNALRTLAKIVGPLPANPGSPD